MSTVISSSNPTPSRIDQIIQGTDFVYGQLADGNSVEVICSGLPLNSVAWVDPTAGDTITVTYKTSAHSSAQAWPPGPVTAYAEYRIGGSLYSMTFQRTGGSGTTSKYGIAR